MYKTVIKRLIDIVLSLVGMIILMPFFVLFSIIVYVDDPGPIFFKQSVSASIRKPFGYINSGV